MSLSLRIEAIQTIVRYAELNGGRMPAAAFCGPMTYRDLVREMRRDFGDVPPNTPDEILDAMPKPDYVIIAGVNHYPGPGRLGFSFYYAGPASRPGESGTEPYQQPPPI